MSLISGYQASKAIDTILTQQSITNEAGKAAVQKLKRLGASAIPKLIESLGQTRDTGIIESLLVSFLEYTSVETYIAALNHDNPRVPEGIVRVLKKSSDYDPNALLQSFTNSNIPKSPLGEILLAQKDRVDVKQLIRILDKVTSNTRPILYRILDQIITVESVPLLVAKMTSKEPLVRTYIASILAQFDTEDTLQTLLSSLSDPNKSVRQAALTSLAALKSPASIEPICQLLKDPDLTVQSVAIDTLVKIRDPSTVRQLVTILQDESEYVRRAAVEVLNEVGDQRAIKDLLNALKDADWWVKVRAADALGSIGGPKVIDAVLLLIKDEDDFLRRTAVEILNTSQDPRAYTRLIDALKDADWWVRERAADALAAIGDKRAVLPLIEMISDSPDSSQVIVRALAKLGDQRALTPILNLLKNESDTVRKEALQALAQLATKENAAEIQNAVTELIDSHDQYIKALATDTVNTLFTKFGVKPSVHPGSELINFDQAEELVDENAETIKLNVSSPSHNVLIDAAAFQSGEFFAERYKIIKHVGKGAFGVVILVEDTVVNDQFILKFLSPHVASDSVMIQRFTHELRYARKVTHENIIRIYDLITHGQTYAISMEYFPSHSLAYELKRDKIIALERGLDLLSQICHGMLAAEVSQVVHRDLKPSNILINNDGLVKVVDFGLAAAATRPDSRLTKTGVLVGTPTYMSPEQVRGKTIDSKTDIYSLGVIMYEMFTGHVPYTGEGSLAIMFQHVEGKAKPPRDINPDIPQIVEDLIKRSMAVDASDRYQSFADVLKAISRISEELSCATH